MAHRVTYRDYRSEDLPRILALVEAHLSEPYSVFTYYFFVQTSPHLCRTAWLKDSDGGGGAERMVGVVLGRVSLHETKQTYANVPASDASGGDSVRVRGYIGMVVVAPECRRMGVGRALAEEIIARMVLRDGVDEVVLETEADNAGALGLYASLGFVRHKRLARYYMNGSDAYRLKLWTRM